MQEERIMLSGQHLSLEPAATSWLVKVLAETLGL